MLTVRYSRLLRYVPDAERSLAALREAVVGSGIWVDPHAPNHSGDGLPAWFAVHFTATHGDYKRLHADVERILESSRLAGELHPEGAYA
jgi:hypothetical protein